MREVASRCLINAQGPLLKLPTVNRGFCYQFLRIVALDLH